MSSPGGWTRGRRLGVDVGRARIGVASCDPDGLLATPVETITVRGAGWDAELRRLADLVDEYEAVALVVGLPINLAGRDTESTRMAHGFVERWLELRPEVPVELVDERMSTGAAITGLRSAGRSARRQRDVVDQAAAVQILQGWLDRVRRTAQPDALPPHPAD